MSLWLCTSLVMSTGLSYESVVTGFSWIDGDVVF